MNLRLRLIASLVSLAALPLTVSAHNTWLLPSATVLPEKQWITVDAAVSNDLFHLNHRPLTLDALSITAPDGSKPEPQGAHTGRFRSVFDLELVMQFAFEPLLEFGRLGKAHIVQRQVNLKGGFALADLPDMQVVHINDPLQTAKLCDHTVVLETLGRTIHQHRDGLTDFARPVDQHINGDGSGHRRIDPVDVWPPNHDGHAADDDRDCGQGIGDHVKEGAADVEATQILSQHPCCGDVFDKSNDANDDHRCRDDFCGLKQSGSRFIKQIKPDDDERREIDQGANGLGSRIAERSLFVGGAARDAPGNIGDQH